MFALGQSGGTVDGCPQCWIEAQQVADALTERPPGNYKWIVQWKRLPGEDKTPDEG